jgi:hypothetical protein
MWVMAGAAVAFLVYLCLGLFFVSIPLAVVTVPLGVILGIGLAVVGAQLTLFGVEDSSSLYKPHDHIEAMGANRPVPVDDAWVVYFPGQAWRDGVAASHGSLVVYVGLTLGAADLVRKRMFGWGVVLLSLPVTVPIGAGWLAVPVGIAVGLAVGWAVGAVVTGVAWAAGSAAVVVLNLVDRVGRRLSRSTAACPNCYHVTPTPAYRCPGPHGELADSLHYDLRPGRQGVWWRRCGCGERLPTGVRRARRERLHPYCPLCHQRLHPDAGLATDVRIALVGAGSAGKTSVLAATLRGLDDRYAAENARFAPGNRASQARIEKLRADFLAGRPTTRTDPAMPPAGLLLHVVRGRRRALLQFFDIAGVLLSDPDDLAYLEHARALLLVVDPFALESVRTEAHELRPDLLDFAHPAPYAQEQAYQDVAIALRNTHMAHRQRLAVIVTKTDLLRELPLGKDLGRSSGEIRAWLLAQREDNLVLAAERDFGRVRFFRCGAVVNGETPVEAIRWLLSPEPFPLPSRSSDGG